MSVIVCLSERMKTVFMYLFLIDVVMKSQQHDARFIL